MIRPAPPTGSFPLPLAMLDGALVVAAKADGVEALP